MLENVTPLALAVASAAVFAGSLLQGAVGFGVAMVAAPVLLQPQGRLIRSLAGAGFPA